MQHHVAETLESIHVNRVCRERFVKELKISHVANDRFTLSFQDLLFYAVITTKHAGVNDRESHKLNAIDVKRKRYAVHSLAV